MLFFKLNRFGGKIFVISLFVYRNQNLVDINIFMNFEAKVAKLRSYFDRNKLIIWVVEIYMGYCFDLFVLLGG